MNSPLHNSWPLVPSLSVNTHSLESSRVDKQLALSLLEAQRAELGVAADACMVCAVYRSQPNDVVFETEAAQVRLDRFACTPGHLLIVPKQHVEHTTELT